MKGFKGTDKDGKCRGFQYEENHDYEFESAKLCYSGGHFCTSPLDVLKYYYPSKGSRYFAVESADEDVSPKVVDYDSKRVTKKLHIGEEIGIEGLIKEHINFVNKNIDVHIKHGDLDTVIAGDHGAATAGYRSTAVAGNHGAATAGKNSAATVGCYGAATAGEGGVATASIGSTAISGNYGVATTGNCSVAKSGDCGMATTGDHSVAIAGKFGTATAGEYSTATVGKDGVATVGFYGAATVGLGGVATANSFGIATAGKRGIATTGFGGTAIAGDYGIATSHGKSSVGEYGSAFARGFSAKARGGLGSILVLVEEETYSYYIKDWRAFIIDGKNYKPDTWYKLENGEVVEVKEEDEQKQKSYRGLRSE